jgi:NADH-quinone oxidoreductase subunit E
MDQGTMIGKTPALETQQFNTVCEILRRNHNDPARLIPILQQVQKEYRYLPEEVLTFIATPLRLRPAQVYGVATFYSHFSLQPHGKYTIRLCDGTACHVRRSTGILDVLYERLGVSEERKTTDDQLFTVETVSCLGACGLAPVMLVNEKVYGQVTPEKALEIIEELIAKETQA